MMRLTDDEIRKRLADIRYGLVDEWRYLMQCTENPELQEMIQVRLELAYHAEEYSVDNL